MEAGGEEEHALRGNAAEKKVFLSLLCCLKGKREDGILRSWATAW